MPELNDKREAGVDLGRWSFGFNGQYRHSLDEKGRLSVPANFRRDAAGNAIGRFKLTVGFERCLFLFPAEYWQAVVEPQLLELPIMERQARLVTRMLLSRAADLGSEAIVNGMYNRVEVWSVDRWLAYETEAVAAFEDMAARYRIKF
jgi:MraZ protein